MLKSRDKCYNECRDKTCSQATFEFKAVFESRFENGFECVYAQSENAMS